MKMNKVPLYQFRPPKLDVIPFEVVRIEAMGPIARKPVPHRLAFYGIFWVTAGSGTHFLDFVGDEIRPNSLHFIGPGQVHYWEIESELKGYAILFESALALELGDCRLLEQINFFHTLNGLSVLYLSGSDANRFQKIIEQLEQEYTQQQFARSLSIVSWLQLLLIEAQRLAMAANATREMASADQQLAYRYINLVEQHAIAQHKVEWYAAELAVTVAHLSKSVKNALGMTAGALLRNRLVLEAKRLLVHSDLTASEIATRLNFKDASYFGRFFKRETQKTPRAFRTQFPTKYQNQPTK